MFTSRAEYRLALRADNADQRLTAKAMAAGLVAAPRARVFAAKMAALEDARARLDALTATPQALLNAGLEVVQDGVRRSAFQLLAYPDVTIDRLGTHLAGAGVDTRGRGDADPERRPLSGLPDPPGGRRPRLPPGSRPGGTGRPRLWPRLPRCRAKCDPSWPRPGRRPWPLRRASRALLRRPSPPCSRTCGGADATRRSA